MQDLEKIYKLRKTLHENPEKSFEEIKTKKIILDFLKDNTSFEIVDRGKWFYAFKKSENSSKQAIALRADIDALSLEDGTVGHFCGHDGHASILCNVAMLLSNTKLNRDIYLIFQPAEEIGKGAILCSELIREKQISEVYGLHNIPGKKCEKVLLRKNTFSCASVGVKIEYIGKPTHAAYPENGINPALAFSKLILKLDDLTKIYKKENEVLMATVIGLNLGSDQFGLSAYSGNLNLTVRGQDQNSFEAYLNAIKEQAEYIAESYSLICTITETDYFPATVNDDSCVSRLEEICKKENISYEYLDEPMRWSEDFAYYTQKCKGAFFGIGDGFDYPQLHNDKFEFNDDIIEIASKMFIELCC